MKTIDIGGKERPVKYNFNALIEFEELTGIDIVQSGNNPTLFGKLKNMRALAFVGLKHGAIENDEKPDFSIDDVGKWISFGDDSMDKFFVAFSEDGKSDSETTGEENEIKKK